MTRRVRFRLVVGLATLGAITACVVDPLNPQPLPPGPLENGASFGSDASGPPTLDANTREQDAADTLSDSGIPEAPGIDGGDASDADGGDASDADAG